MLSQRPKHREGGGPTRSSAATRNAQWAFRPSEDCLSMGPPPSRCPTRFQTQKRPRRDVSGVLLKMRAQEGLGSVPIPYHLRQR